MRGATKKILGLHEDLVLSHFNFKHLNKALTCATFIYIYVHCHLPKL